MSSNLKKLAEGTEQAGRLSDFHRGTLRRILNERDGAEKMLADMALRTGDRRLATKLVNQYFVRPTETQVAELREASSRRSEMSYFLLSELTTVDYVLSRGSFAFVRQSVADEIFRSYGVRLGRQYEKPGSVRRIQDELKPR